MQGACGPPYQSSAAASAPCSWSMSHMSAEVLDVVVVPEARGDAVRVVGLGVDRAVLGADRRVAALGLHRPEVRLVEGLLGAEAVAVGDLVEAVLHRLRADLDRLEEDVVLRVTRHSRKPPLDRTGTGILGVAAVRLASARSCERSVRRDPDQAGRVLADPLHSLPEGAFSELLPVGAEDEQADALCPGRPRGPS